MEINLAEYIKARLYGYVQACKAPDRYRAGIDGA